MMFVKQNGSVWVPVLVGARHWAEQREGHVPVPRGDVRRSEWLSTESKSLCVQVLSTKLSH